jgi:hypothetical protein
MKLIPKADQDQAIDQTKEHLRMIAGMKQPRIAKTLGYTSPEQFILDWGWPFYTDENSFVGERGQVKACYMNAFQLATSHPSKYTYVEGYIHIAVLPVEHAWVVDNKTGMVVDPTMNPPEEGKTVYALGYFGVPIKEKYLIATALRTGVYGVISGMTNPGLLKGEHDIEDVVGDI